MQAGRRRWASRPRGASTRSSAPISRTNSGAASAAEAGRDRNRNILGDHPVEGAQKQWLVLRSFSCCDRRMGARSEEREAGYWAVPREIRDRPDKRLGDLILLGQPIAVRCED